MKKLLALSIAALGAGMATPSIAASSNADIYGKVSIYQGFVKGHDGDYVATQEDDTSRIGFRGTEDLGNGLKANFVIETGFKADQPEFSKGKDNSSLGNRIAIVGLQNSFGSVHLGRNKHAWSTAFDNYSPIGTDYGHISSTIAPMHGTRFSNGVFLSANTGLAGGTLTGRLDHSSSEKDDVTGGTSFSTEYRNGNLRGLYGYHREQESKNLGVETQSSHMLAARYQVTKSTAVMGMATRTELKDGDDVASWQIGGVHKFDGTNISLAGGYGRNNLDDYGYNARVSYAFSPRTQVHAIATKLNGEADQSKDRTILALGLQHGF